MNLPNKLTVLRIIMVPFFVFFMLTDAGGAANGSRLLFSAWQVLQICWTVRLLEQEVWLQTLENSWILLQISCLYVLQ